MLAPGLSAGSDFDLRSVLYLGWALFILLSSRRLCGMGVGVGSYLDFARPRGALTSLLSGLTAGFDPDLELGFGPGFDLLREG